jgi:hypothetical protein
MYKSKVEFEFGYQQKIFRCQIGGTHFFFLNSSTHIQFIFYRKIHLVSLFQFVSVQAHIYTFNLY